MVQLDMNKKTTFLLFVSGISVYATKICSPFFSKELNKLELASNIAAGIILFSGKLYSENIVKFWQALLFIIIMISNTIFFSFSFLFLVRVLIVTNIKKLILYFPRFHFLSLSMFKMMKQYFGKHKVKKMPFKIKKTYEFNS